MRLRTPLHIRRDAIELIVEYDRIAERTDAYWEQVPFTGEPANLFIEQCQGVAFEESAKHNLSVDDWLRVASFVQQLVAGKLRIR
ncbi:MAG: hypothetical protein KDA37_10030 [Planctomycetales bacterium]|nr:hypothetical protein [Planctomycetales bacterium]